MAQVRALLVIDVQRDFTERIAGADDLPAAVSRFLADTRDRYDVVIASRDWHDGDNDNGGHFPPAPAGSGRPWITHCVAGSRGAEYSDGFDTASIDVHVLKGQGRPSYSIFEGTAPNGEPMPDLVRRLGITDVDIVGIATEFCVAAAAVDAVGSGIRTRILSELCRPADPARADEVLDELAVLGVTVERE